MDYMPIIIIGVTIAFAAAVFAVLAAGHRQRQAAKKAAAEGVMLPTKPKPQPMTVERLNTLSHSEVLADLNKQLREGGFVQIGFGILMLIAFGPVSTSYGWVLLVSGVMSFFFKDSAMFFVYGCTLIWVAIANLTAGSIGWLLFALFQLFGAYHHFRRFVVYQRAEKAAAALAVEDSANAQSNLPTLPTSPSERLFPWIGAVCGIVSLFGIVGSISAIFLMSIDDASVLESLDVVINFLVVAGVMGSSIGLASIAAKHRLWGMGVVGAITGVLGLATVLIISALGSA